MLSLEDIVATTIRDSGSDESTVALWKEIFAAYEYGGPDGIKALIRTKVREAERRAEKEAKASRLVVQVVAKPRRVAKARRT